MTHDHHSVGLSDRDRVDHAIGGGLPTGSVVLIEGEDGAGKSVLSQRFAYGLLEEGATVAVASTELSAGEYVDQMHSLSYDVVDHLLGDRLAFFHADVDAQGERALLSRFTQPSALWRPQITIVDGFGALLRNDPEFDGSVEREDEDHTMQSLVSFLREATAGDGVVVLTLNPESVTPRALRPLRDVADVYLQLQTNTVGQEIRREALVRRFAGMKNPVDDTIGFSVQQGRGVVIESRTVA